MNIVLINPPWQFGAAGDIILSQNLGLGYLAGFLREKGRHQVRILDTLAEGFKQRTNQADGTVKVGLTHPQIIERISPAPDLIGITVPFSHLTGLVEQLCRDLKTAYPSTLIILGGVHPSTCPQEFTHSSADYWLIGEGETALLALAGGVAPDEIAGLLSKDKPAPTPGEKAVSISDLDEIPFPARDLLPMALYATLSPRRISHKSSASIITSRGCPWDCHFCSIHPMHGYQWRKRSAENVLAEIKFLVETYGIRQLEFEDDNLTLHRGRALELFEGICRLKQQLHIDLTWGTPNGIRSETVDREMLQLMQRSGCVRVTFALEHGEEEVRRAMNKKLDLDKFETALRDAIDLGLHVEVFTMIGYPGETLDRFEASRQYYRKIRAWGVKTIHVFYPQPYPGTRLYQFCRQHRYLAQENYSLMPPIKIETEDFDAAEVRRRRELLLTEFDKTYRMRQSIKSLLPQTVINTLNKYLPRKAM